MYILINRTYTPYLIARTYKQVSTYVHTYVRTICVHIYMYVYIYLYVRKNICTYYIYGRTYKSYVQTVRTDKYLRMYEPLLTNTYDFCMYMYVYIYIYVHTDLFARSYLLTL
jgi:hypothetical protein